MAANTYTMRGLLNQLIMNAGEVPDYGFGRPVQSPLEKAARAIRNATKVVQYYSPGYPYQEVSYMTNESAKQYFADDDFGK
jgi:hypothetical protein